jgi:phospholipase/carboxylesterase
MSPLSLDPHAGAALHGAGAAPDGAGRALILLHGRGGTAADILGLVRLARRPDLAGIAPQAVGNSWWPVSFLAPMETLAPWLDSALAAVDRAVASAEAAGIARDRIILGGFSQGACLALEWAARRGGPLAGVLGFSGGLVGTADAPGGPQPALYGHAPKAMEQAGRLDGVPVWLGCHAQDPHIPAARVAETAAKLAALGARVEHVEHPGAGHGVTPADVAALQRMAAG